MQYGKFGGAGGMLANQFAGQRPAGPAQYGRAPARPMPAASARPMLGAQPGGASPFGGGLAAARQAPPPQRAQQGQMGRMAGMANGMMMSDKHSKDEIKRLEGANDALSRALTSHAEYPDAPQPQASAGAHVGSNMPATEYPTMPSSTKFSPPQPSPTAQKLAAQNQVMAPQQPAPTPPPQGDNPFNVNRGNIDMAALDEAYKNLGRGG